jgi:ferrochelatase
VARSEASWDRYIEDVREARARVGSTAPEVVFAPPWSAEPGFRDAVAARARAALAEVPASDRGWAPLVFTAHSLPVAMAEASPYVAEINAAAHAVVDALGHPRYSIAYQSRSGSPHDAWLEPDINDVLRRLGADGEQHAVVVPIGFIVDHVEVLYDLDVQARATADAVGVVLHRAGAVNDHPEFIAALARIVASAT